MAALRGSVGEGQRGACGRRRPSLPPIACLPIQPLPWRPSEQLTQPQVQDFVSTEQSLSSLRSQTRCCTAPLCPIGLPMVSCSWSVTALASTFRQASRKPMCPACWPTTTHGSLSSKTLPSTQYHVHLQSPQQGLHEVGHPLTYGAARLVLEPAGTGYFRVDHPAFGNSDQMAIHRYDSKSPSPCSTSLFSRSDHGSQPAPDAGPLVQHVLRHTLRCRVRYARRARHSKEAPALHFPRSVWARRRSPPSMSLCRSLQHGS